MKGIVEIYGTSEDGSRELIYQDENMTTIGFSENIVDMLTTPSSIVSSTHTNDYLNPKNYIINAISFSKSKEQFTKNLHSYSTTNLLHNSINPGTGGWDLDEVTLTPGAVQGANFDSSGYLLDSTTSAGSLSQTILYDDTVGAFGGSYFSATDFIFSVDIKMNPDNPPIQVSSGPSGEYRGYSQLAISGNGVASGMIFEWDEKGVPTPYNRLQPTYSFGSNVGGIKSLGGGWYRAFVYSQYMDGGDNGPTVAYVYPSLGPLGEHVVGGGYSAAGSAGSIFINRPQLELAAHPTNYVETTGVSTRDNLLRYSRLNATPPYGIDVDGKSAINYYVVSDSGGPTLSGIYDGSLDKGVSAYIPANTELKPTANPDDRELTPGASTPVEEAFGVQITKGQISGCQHMWDRLRVTKYDTSWIYAKNYIPYFGRHLSYVGAFTSKDNWVVSGSLSTENQTGGGGGTKIQVQNWVHYVSAYDDYAYDNPVSSLSIGSRGLLSGFGKNSSTTDMDGYISIINDATPAGPGDSGDTSANWAGGESGGGRYRPQTQSQILSDFSSTGEVTYHMRLLNMSGQTTVPAGTDPIYDFVKGATRNDSDSVLLNLFGGVDVIGLWGFDLPRIREELAYKGRDGEGAAPYPYILSPNDSANVNGNTADYGAESAASKNHPWEPYRKYKLYSKKVLTDNIMKNEGFETSAGIFGHYKNLDLYWKVKFL